MMIKCTTDWVFINGLNFSVVRRGYLQTVVSLKINKTHVSACVYQGYELLAVFNFHFCKLF